MVSRRLIITDRALSELQAEIIYHRANTSEAFASTMKTDFMSRVDSILPNPYIYPECRFLPTKTQIYRNIVWDNYLIIYKIKKDAVEVLSVFHTKQKPAKIRLVRKKKK
jgi:plasmid stabilization system protein ParE